MVVHAIITRILLIVFSAMLILVADLTTSLADSTALEPQWQYESCSWGWLVIHDSHASEKPFISITSPEDHSGILTAPFIVTGKGRGIPDGKIEVTVYNNAKNGQVYKALFAGMAQLTSVDQNGEGEWLLDVNLPDLPPATSVRVYAQFEAASSDVYTNLAFVDVNMNSAQGLPMVRIDRPNINEGVAGDPLIIEGTGSVASENKISITVRDWVTYHVLSEAFTTIQSDEVGGTGRFVAEIPMDVQPGTLVEIRASFEPLVDSGITPLYDQVTAVINPLEAHYDNLLVVQYDDRFFLSDGNCPHGEEELKGLNTELLTIDTVKIIRDETSPSEVVLSITAIGSSGCAALPRAHVARQQHGFAVTVYRDKTIAEKCVDAPILVPVSVPLYIGDGARAEIIVNGQRIE
ncbi:MAG: hypothetical protein R3E39_23430 [Anaerolineae bacterium]